MLETAEKVWERLGDNSSEQSLITAGKARERVRPRMEPIYLPEDVIRFLENYEDGGTVTVLFSGDTGFYSGTKKLARALSERKIPFETEPGVSSAVYLASRLGISWENALFFTAHGRKFDSGKGGYPAEAGQKLWRRTGRGPVDVPSSVRKRDGGEAVQAAFGSGIFLLPGCYRRTALLSGREDTEGRWRS